MIKKIVLELKNSFHKEITQLSRNGNQLSGFYIKLLFTESYLQADYDFNSEILRIRFRYRSLFCISYFYHLSTMSLKISRKDGTVINFEVNVIGHQNSFGLMVWWISVILMLHILLRFRRASTVKHLKTLIDLVWIDISPSSFRYRFIYR